jgi:hypothetical protein
MAELRSVAMPLAPENQAKDDLDAWDLIPLFCPECDMAAFVEWSTTCPSTDGPLEHVKIRCLNRHWFLMLAERLA